MRSRVVAAAMALAAVLIWGCGESKAPAAKATLVDAQGQKVAEARLSETPGGEDRPHRGESASRGARLSYP